MRHTTKLTSMVFMILIGATAFGLVFRGIGGDRLVLDVMSNLPAGVWGFLFVSMLLIFILGFFLVNFVIQINGKKKATISSKYNINQKDLLDQLTNDKNLSKLIVGKEIEKSFFVKNRLINILLK